MLDTGYCRNALKDRFRIGVSLRNGGTEMIIGMVLASLSRPNTIPSYRGVPM